MITDMTVIAAAAAAAAANRIFLLHPPPSGKGAVLRDGSLCIFSRLSADLPAGFL